MLVLGPNSTCDVCLECYTSGANVPHAISCGHVFCQKCLDHLIQHKCPLCRERFSPRDIRKLHVDRDPFTKAVEPPPSESEAVAPQIDKESQRLLDDIARIVKEGGKVNEIRRVIDECRAYYKSLPGNQYTPVRVSCLLLHNLLEAQRKQVLQSEQLREANAARDEIRDRLTSEFEALQLKYDDLERTSRDEKDTALAIEKSLREHYDQMNNFWKGQMESVNQECRSLRDQLDRLRSSGAMIPPPPPRSIELQHIYRSEPKRTYSNIEDSALSVREEMMMPKGKFIEVDNYDFHLSPLKEFAAPLASTAPSLMALGDDSDPDDMARAKRARSPIQEEPEPDSELEDSGASASTAIAYPFPAHLQPPTTKIDPIPIPGPSRTPPSRQSSAMAISFTADHHWPSSGISSHKSRDDVVMTSNSSRAPSPSRRHSSGPRPMSKESSTSLVREMSDLKRQDSMEMAGAPVTVKDQLVSKLYDLLDSPRPASTLHGHMLMQQQQQQPPHTDLPEPTLPRPVSRLTTPSRPASTSLHGTSTNPHHPDDACGGGVAPDHRKPLVRASEVAMQLERERMEKERRRLREVSGPSLSSSLKDTTNVVGPMDGHYPMRHRSIGAGGGGGGGGGSKPKIAPGPGPMFAHSASYHAHVHAHGPAHTHAPAHAEAVM